VATLLKPVCDDREYSTPATAAAEEKESGGSGGMRRVEGEGLVLAWPGSGGQAFAAAGVELRGDSEACGLGVSNPATEEDWSTEYSDLILSVRVVDGLEEALAHIARYGSRHTDAICTTDDQTAERFLAAVDSAGVYHNCSTRFADGFRYGFGAEVGISTQTLPPRGPVGLEGLVTYRYLLRGDGHIAADYAGGGRSFSHRNLPL
jgi:glutamate-5-semialdehyde dehydrogenase